MKVFAGQNRLPIKLWSENIEDSAFKQAENLANLPFAFKHIALMPDVHTGYGMPIGGVLATKGVVIPNAVGVDIGCGMLAIRTNLTDISREKLLKIVKSIKAMVPVGMKHHNKPKHVDHVPSLNPHNCESFTESKLAQWYPVVFDQHSALQYQIGTLGGGNHFIEIQEGSDGHIWFMIHSGSRNLGLRVAKYHNEIAKNLNKMWHSNVPREYDLAFLPLDSEEGETYMREMDFCVRFALNNRLAMCGVIMDAFTDHLPDTEFDFPINIAHNYAAIENHYGENVVVHRKGATKATSGLKGIIPGSQGTKSYIVEGLGNQESFMSCSHGAGRVLGRKAAQRELDLAEEQRILDDQGIIHDMKSKANLEEAASAYKPIDVVMKNQADLTKILVELQPLAVIKG